MALAACSEGPEGEMGAAGPPGKDGIAGTQGAVGPSGSAGATGDAGTSPRAASLVWKDASGVAIPVVGISDSTFNNGLYPFNWLHYLGSDGTMWTIAVSTGQVYPVQISSEIAALSYEAPNCAGTAYVTTALPARVTFRLPNDPEARYIKDSAVVKLNASFVSYQVMFGGPCTNNGLNANAAVALSDTTVVAVPKTVYKLPLRPELSK